MPKRCIVIGASAGGFEVLNEIVSQFPAELPAPVLVVMHVPAQHTSFLPEILSRSGPLPAEHPKDGETVRDGRIYVAPPDHHLLIDDSHVAVKRGPKENGFRPSIDALFRSAAYSYGPGAIGVVLSGALHDGTSGLWSIKRLGGVAIVQDPYEARVGSMPRSALEYVEADYKVRAAEIAPLLVELAQKERGAREAREGEGMEDGLEQRIAREVQIAAGTLLDEKTVLALGELSPFTCPKCHGVLVRIKDGNRSRFRCHTGHGFTEEALLELVMKSAEDMLFQVRRGLQEVEMLLEHMGRHLQEAGETMRAMKFLARARQVGRQISRLQDLAQEHEGLSADPLDEGQPAD